MRSASEMSESTDPIGAPCDRGAGVDPAALAADPARVVEVPPEDAPRLIGEAEALRAALWARLQAAPSPTPPPTNGKGDDRLLTVAEAASILGVDDRWMYRHAASLPFTRKLGGRTLRFSELGLERWLESRR